MTKKCRDCGVVYKPQGYDEVRSICPECLELRGKIVDAMKANKFTKETFEKLQRKIRSTRGTAAKAMRAALDGIE